MFEISDTGKQMLKLQDDLVRQYAYRKQPDLIGEMNMNTYHENLPEEMQGEKKHVDSEKPGYEVEGKDIPLYSKSGTKIAERYDRIVIGHYGAFLEISPKDIILDNVECKKGQEFRINNPEYANRVKYHWFTAKDDSDCKLYFQQRGVNYADYKPDKWYVSPYEVCDEKERDLLEMEEEIDR